jgi:pimeloyl-ACP methyl ester carboxylesterase
LQNSIPALSQIGQEVPGYDPVVPVLYAEAFHAGFPNSTLTYLNAGHSPQFEIPDVVQSEVLSFIQTH